MGANWTSPSLSDLIDSYTLLDGHNNIPDLVSNFENYKQLEDYIQESFSTFNQNIAELNDKFGINEISVVAVMKSQNKLSKVLKQRFFKKFLRHIEISITFNKQNQDDYMKIKTIPFHKYLLIVEEFKRYINNKPYQKLDDSQEQNNIDQEEEKHRYGIKQTFQLEESKSTLFGDNSSKDILIDRMDQSIISEVEQEFLCDQRRQDLKSISRYLEDEERDLCPICDDKDSDILLVCMHVFCEQCITDWYLRNGSCPMCRIEAGLDNYLMVKPVQMSLLRTVLND